MTEMQLEKALALRRKTADAGREVAELQTIRNRSAASVPVYVFTNERNTAIVPQAVALDLIDRAINRYNNQIDGWTAEFLAL